MIVRDGMSPWQVLTTLKGSIIRKVLPKIGFTVALTAVIATLQRLGYTDMVKINPLVLSLIGAALAIVTGFRNSAAYDRWWEARKLLGLVVIDTRGLSRQANAYIADAQIARRISGRSIAFAMVLRDFLHGRPIGPDAAKYLEPEELNALQGNRNAPNLLLDFMSKDISAAMAAGNLRPEMALTLEERVASLSVGSASAERTKSTPMPFLYSLGVHRVAYIFCLLLPFGLVDDNGYWTPLLVGVISYIFFGLDAIGEEMEKPFSDSVHAIPLDAIATVIEINILQSLGETDLPPWPTAVDFVLS